MSAHRCPVDWGSATPSQRCTRESGHYGVHIDVEGREFGYVPNHDDPWGETRADVMSSSPGQDVELTSTQTVPLVSRRICTHCGQSWDNPDHVCACNMGVRHRRLAAEYVRQYIENCGPCEGDPFDADLWMHEAACLLGQIAGTP